MATVKMVALAQFIASKLGKTGLTVTCDVDEYDIDNSTVDNAFLTAQSMTEVRRGIYRLFFDGDDTKLYTATAITSDSSVDQQHIAAVIVRLDRVNNADVTTSSRLASASYTAPLDATDTQTAAEAALTAYDAATAADVAGISVPSAATVADAVASVDPADYGIGTAGYAWAAAGSSTDFLSAVVPGAYASGTAGHALGRIANGQLTIVQPVLDDGFFRIVPGRDYLADDGMAFTFSSTSWPTLPDGTTVEFIFGDETLTGERTGDQAVRLEVTAAQGTALAEARSGRQHYDIVATLPSNSVVGLAENAPVLVG